MKFNKITKTATTPAFAMSGYGHPCARVRTIGAISADVAAAVRADGDFWDLLPGGPPLS